ncbi:MAG: TolC family protein, partial [Longimicrobiales bacterium]
MNWRGEDTASRGRCAAVLAAALVASTWWLVPAGVRAQERPGEMYRLSLEEALARAQDASEPVAVAAAGVRRARGGELRALSDWLPNLSATASYDRALASEFEGVFGGGATSPDTTSAPGDSAGGGLDFGELPFGRETTWRFGLSLTQNLYAGGRIRAQNRIADASSRTAVLVLSSERAQALLTAAEAYYDAALAARLAEIADSTLALTETTVAHATLAAQVGAQPEFELLRARVARDNQLSTVVQRRSDRELAFLRLKQLLDIPADAALELTTDLDGELTPVERVTAELVDLPTDTAAPTRVPVRQAAEVVRMRAASLDIAEAQRLPSISAYSQYGRVAYPDGTFPRWGEFRTNWSVGVQLQLPVFLGGRILGDEAVAEADLAEAEALLRRTQELTQLDTRAAYERLDAARAAWQASSGTAQQAARAYEIAELRYREGISAQIELTDARVQLAQAGANRARAARDVQVARIRV